MKKLLGVIVLLAAALSAQSVAQEMPGWARSAPSSDPVIEQPPPPPPPPPPVPLDGLSLLALAGAGYAAHRLRRSRNA